MDVKACSTHSTGYKSIKQSKPQGKTSPADAIVLQFGSKRASSQADKSPNRGSAWGIWQGIKDTLLKIVNYIKSWFIAPKESSTGVKPLKKPGSYASQASSLIRTDEEQAAADPLTDTTTVVESMSKSKSSKEKHKLSEKRSEQPRQKAKTITESLELFQQEKALANQDSAELLKAIIIKTQSGNIPAVIYRKGLADKDAFIYELRKPKSEGGELLEALKSQPEQVQFYQLPVKDFITLEFQGEPISYTGQREENGLRIELRSALLEGVLPQLGMAKKPLLGKNCPEHSLNSRVMYANGFIRGTELNMKHAPDNTLASEDYNDLVMPKEFKLGLINTKFCPPIPFRPRFIQPLSVYRNEPFKQTTYHLYGNVSPEGVVTYQIARPLRQGGQVFATTTAIPKESKLNGSKVEPYYELSFDISDEEAQVVNSYKHDYEERLTEFLLARTLKTLDETGKKTVLLPKAWDDEFWRYKPDKYTFALGLMDFPQYAHEACLHDPKTPSKHLNAHEWPRQYFKPEDCGRIQGQRARVRPSPDLLGNVPFTTERGVRVPIKAYGHLSGKGLHSIWLDAGDEDERAILLRLGITSNSAELGNFPNEKFLHLEFDFDNFPTNFSLKDKRVLMNALLDKTCEEAKQKGLILLIKRSVLTLGQEDLLRKHGFTQDVQGVHARYPGPNSDVPRQYLGAFIYDGSR